MVETTPSLQPLNKKNLEELNRQTGSVVSDNMDRAVTAPGGGDKKRSLSRQSSTTEMYQEATSISSQKAVSLANYRWKNLDYAEMVIEDEPIPDDIESRVGAIIQPEISTERKRELSVITETFCDGFIDVMKGASREDDAVEPIHRALTSMDKTNRFMFPRKAGIFPSYTSACMVLLTLFWTGIRV